MESQLGIAALILRDQGSCIHQNKYAVQNDESTTDVTVEPLSAPHRPLSCCSDRRLVVRRLGRRHAGNAALLLNYFP